jgi:putative YphP/YqiW family bacilliredoxin
MRYDSLLLQPMRDEVTRLGLSELRDAAAVDEFLAETTGTSLVFVNSVCGCAAGNARPSLALALAGGAAPRPDRMATVFAGQDPEATAGFRAHFPDVPPSSPSMFLLKDGEVVLHIPRHGIEGREADAIAADLTAAFAEHC